jgi:hypothetical protein
MPFQQPHPLYPTEIPPPHILPHESHIYSLQTDGACEAVSPGDSPALLPYLIPVGRYSVDIPLLTYL